mmetsp:Transcript_10564/g.18702  ORF Transcript_10564/g.18702 Transcript_10564/m.18702 type:complete len:293 (+) Transcript_10564:51-929(+)
MLYLGCCCALLRGTNQWMLNDGWCGQRVSNRKDMGRNRGDLSLYLLLADGGFLRSLAKEILLCTAYKAHPFLHVPTQSAVLVELDSKQLPKLHSPIVVAVQSCQQTLKALWAGVLHLTGGDPLSQVLNRPEALCPCISTLKQALVAHELPEGEGDLGEGCILRRAGGVGRWACSCRGQRHVPRTEDVRCNRHPPPGGLGRTEPLEHVPLPHHPPPPNGLYEGRPLVVHDVLLQAAVVPPPTKASDAGLDQNGRTLVCGLVLRGLPQQPGTLLWLLVPTAGYLVLQFLGAPRC